MFSISHSINNFWEYDGLILCDEFHNSDYTYRYDFDSERHYFDKGIAVFYSEVNNCFGIITKDCNRLIDPIFEKISFKLDSASLTKLITFSSIIFHHHLLL